MSPPDPGCDTERSLLQSSTLDGDTSPLNPSSDVESQTRQTRLGVTTVDQRSQSDKTRTTHLVN